MKSVEKTNGKLMFEFPCRLDFTESGFSFDALLLRL